jgi:hypothetical protein
MWRPLPSAVERREAPLAGKAGGAAEGSGTHVASGDFSQSLSAAKDLKLRILRCFAVYAAQHDDCGGIDR